MVDDKRGFIDDEGKIVIEPQFGGASDFSEGLARVAFYEPTCGEGYIDEMGHLVIAPDFNQNRDFSEGLAAVGLGEFTLHGGGDHAWGFIDRSGRIVIEPAYGVVRSFREGLAAALGENQKWGYIDQKGEIAIPFLYDSADDFAGGLACVQRDDRYGFVNRIGEPVIPMKFTSCGGFSEDLARVRLGGEKAEDGYVPGELGGRWLYVDKTGEVVISLGADVVDVGDFSEGLAEIRVKDEAEFTYGYIDRQGVVVIEPRFSYAQPFSEDLASVTLEVNDQPHFINRLGEVVLSPSYDRAGSFRDGLAEIELGNWPAKVLYGYINRSGKVVWAPSR